MGYIKINREKNTRYCCCHGNVLVYTVVGFPCIASSTNNSMVTEER